MGRKLLLLALLPVCSVFALVVVSAVSDYRTAQRLSTYRAQTRLSYVLETLAADLDHERRAAALVRLNPGTASDALLARYERATTQGFARARARALHVAAPVDVVGSLDAARTQRRALVLQLDARSLAPAQSIAGYSVIAENVLGLAAALDGGAPSPGSARAAEAYRALLQAIEAASRERVFVATSLAPRERQPPTTDPWGEAEAVELGSFRENAAGPLVSDLESVLFSPAGLAVQRFRDALDADPAAAVLRMPLQQWLSIAGTRIDALRAVATTAADSVDGLVSGELDGAHVNAARDLTLSLVFLVLVTAMALALRRSITGPLREISVAARGLAHGNLATGVEYSSRDEIGDVAAAFRDVHATTERLVDEIRAKNGAVRENRLDHRADVEGLEGVWSQLLAGMNDNMAAFADMQQRRQHAERETARIFEMSLDLVCVIGFDGYFKRINPAFERTLGYSRKVLLSRPGFDFTHPDDMERSVEAFARLREGEKVERFENRNVCADGSVRWLEWNARAVPEKELVYAVARDITESRRAAEEQSALRRVATLVARAAAPEQVFAAVAAEAGKLLSADAALIGRYGAGPSVTAVVGWRRDGKPVPLGTDVRLGGQNVISLVFSTGGSVRLEAYSGATGELAELARASGVGSAIGVPISVEGRLWGVMMVSLEHEQTWPTGTEERLARFTDLAATAIANAEAREALRHVADEQSALRRVATLVARGVAPEVLFATVAQEAAKVAPGIDMATVGRYTGDGSIEFVGGWSSVGESRWVGKSERIGGRNVSAAVFETGQPARVDRIRDDAAAVTEIARGSGARSSAGAPINVEGQLWGVIIVASVHDDRLPLGIEHELAGFTELVATAIANAQAREELAASRARLVTSADDTRRRIVRDLHDAAQQRLVHTIITLKLARRAHEAGDGQAAGALVGEALDHAEHANTELRELVYGILPTVLNRGGLAAGVAELTARVRVPVDVELTRERFSATVEATAYFVIAEALTNVAKHSGARSAKVCAEVMNDTLRLGVQDDGIGGARADGSGLRGLADRVAALGGQLRIESPDGGGTQVTATLPLPDR